MRRRRGAGGFLPAALVAEQGGLFLDARDGDPEVLAGLKSERAAREIPDHVGDLGVLNRMAFDCAGETRLEIVRQKLQRADTVPAECREKAECVGALQFLPDDLEDRKS